MRRIITVLVLFFVAASASSTKAQSNPSADGLIQTVHLRISGTWTFQEKSPSRIAPIFEDFYDRHSIVQGEVDLFLTPKVSVAPALGFFADRNRDEIDTVCAVGPCPSPIGHYQTSLLFFIPELRVKYHRPSATSDLYVSAGLAYGLGRMKLSQQFNSPETNQSSRSNTVRDSAGGWGLTLLTGFSHRVFKKTSLFIEAGYRHLKTAPFSKDANEPGLAADIDAPPLNLTGPFGSAGLALHL